MADNVWLVRIPRGREGCCDGKFSSSVVCRWENGKRIWWRRCFGDLSTHISPVLIFCFDVYEDGATFRDSSSFESKQFSKIWWNYVSACKPERMLRNFQNESMYEIYFSRRSYSNQIFQKKWFSYNFVSWIIEIDESGKYHCLFFSCL